MTLSADLARSATDFVTDERGGVTVTCDGFPQSYVHPGDPGMLVFEYVQHLALAIDLLPAGRLALTHVGGGGLTLARYVQHTRPGSPQIVLEPDAALTEQVRTRLPLPRGHRIRVRPQDGATGIAGLREDSADVIVLDAYAGGQTPPELSGADFLAQAGRVLRPGGLLAVNTSDEPGLRHTARLLATLRQVVPHTAVLAAREVLKGRRFGNLVLLASTRALPENDLARAVARCDFPTGWLNGRQCDRLAGSARPFGPIGAPTPLPPDPGQWRLR